MSCDLDPLGCPGRRDSRETAPASRTDPEQHFRTDALMLDLKGSSVRGGAVTLAAQLAKFTMQLSATVLLARLLDPADFGLVAMAALPAGFVGLFRGLGLPLAMVQQADLTHGQVSTLFWINVVFSAVLMLLVAGLSPLAAWFFGEPRLVAIGMGIAMTMLLGGLGVQHGALLTRQMHFRALAGMDLASLAAGFAVALWMAAQGFGYWSLVAMPVAQAGVSTALAWTLSDWRPGSPGRGTGVRALLRFGGSVQGVDLAYYLITSMDNVAIGRVLGASELGLYGRAYQLLTMPFSLVTMGATRLVIPALSRLRPHPGRYQRYFRVALESVAAVAFPMVGCLLLLGDDLVLLLLGPDWMQVAPLFRLLGPAALVLPVLVVPGWVCISMGTVRRQLLWCFAFLPLFAGAFLTGVMVGGSNGVAVACSAMNLVFFTAGVGYCLRGSHVGPRDVLAALWRPLGVLAVAAAATSLIAQPLLLGCGLGWRVAANLMFFLVVYAGVYLCAPGARSLIAELLKALGIERSRHGSPAT